LFVFDSHFSLVKDNDDEWGDEAMQEKSAADVDNGFTTLEPEQKLKNDVIVYDASRNQIVLHEDKNYYPDAGL
jgi:hypothetical protein